MAGSLILSLTSSFVGDTPDRRLSLVLILFLLSLATMKLVVGQERSIGLSPAVLQPPEPATIQPETPAPAPVATAGENPPSVSEGLMALHSQLQIDTQSASQEEVTPSQIGTSIK